MDAVTFRAARETVGLSVRECAEMLGVSERTINRWERKPDEYPIPDPVAEWLERQLTIMLDKLDYFIDRATTFPENTVFELPYYRNQAHYDAEGRDPGPVGMVNGLSRAMFAVLSTLGYMPVWTDGPTDAMIATRGEDVPQD